MAGGDDFHFVDRSFGSDCGLGGGTLPVPPSTPPSKSPGKPVVAPPITPLRAPEAPLGRAVSTILAISFGTLTGAVNSGFSTGTGSDSTTAGVSVGDVFSTAAWRCGSGALLTDNGGGGGGGGHVQGRQKLKFSRPGSTVQQIREIQRFASLAPRRIAVFRPSANGRASSGRTVHRSLPSTARNGRPIRRRFE